MTSFVMPALAAVFDLPVVLPDVGNDSRFSSGELGGS
jgi:hypothetical protein